MRYFPRLLAAALFSSGPALAEVPNVVTDIAPLHSLAAMVMGDLGKPALLISGENDPHHMQLRPSQVRALTGADLVFWVGPDLTPWLDNTLASVGASTSTFAMIDAAGITLRHFPDGTTDPHLWLDPDNAIAMIDAITDALIGADPNNGDIYTENSQGVVHMIDDLVQTAMPKLAAAAGAQAILGHDSLGYFTDRFAIQIAGALSNGDATRPGAAHLSKLRKLYQSGTVDCVFLEPGQNPALLQALTGGAITDPVRLDPIGVLLEPGAGLYINLLDGLIDGFSTCRTAR